MTTAFTNTIRKLLTRAGSPQLSRKMFRIFPRPLEQDRNRFQKYMPLLLVSSVWMCQIKWVHTEEWKSCVSWPLFSLSTSGQNMRQALGYATFFFFLRWTNLVPLSKVCPLYVGRWVLTTSICKLNANEVHTVKHKESFTPEWRAMFTYVSHTNTEQTNTSQK